MLLAWLLPDSSYTVLRDGWNRPTYRPRHCRPPLVVRAWQALSAMLIDVRGKYLVGEDEAMATAPRPAS
jgi:hypothetical protein